MANSNSDDSSSPTVERSLGVPIGDVCFKNINLRPRCRNNKNVVDNLLVNNVENDSESTFFSDDSDFSAAAFKLINHSHKTDVMDILSKSPSRNTFKDSNKKERKISISGNKLSDQNALEFNLNTRSQSTPKVKKPSFQDSLSKVLSCSGSKLNVNGTKYKNSSKSSFANSLSNTEKCQSYKRNVKTVTADVHCDNKGNKISMKNNNFSFNSDIESFHPVCSSTKVFAGGTDVLSRTPVNRSSVNNKDVQISGVKKLNSSDVNIQCEVSKHILSEPNCLNVKDTNREDLEEDDLPCTQPVTSILLRGVIAFIDVKVCGLHFVYDNVKHELESMGAEVENRFSKKVTHVIFRDGLLSTYRKAKKWKIPLVSIIWINACKTSLACLPVAGYEPAGLETYEAKVSKNMDNDLFNINRKRQSTSARLKKLQTEVKKRIEAAVSNKERVTAVPNEPSSVLKTPVNPSNQEYEKFNLFEAFVNNLGEEIQEMINRSDSPSSSEDFHVPVPISIIRKCISPRKAKTDMKGLHMKSVNIDSKITERRRNLDPLLRTKTSNNNNFVSVENDINKENSREEQLSERRSAPSELVTFKTIDKKKKSDKSKEKINDLVTLKIVDKKKNYGKSKEKISKKEYTSRNDRANNLDSSCNSNSDTQTRKRQLLPLAESLGDLLVSDILNVSHEQMPLRNPYDSPKPKIRKVLHKDTSEMKKVQRNQIDCVSLKRNLRSSGKEKENHNKEIKNNLNISRRSSSVFFTGRRNTKTKSSYLSPSIVCTGINNKEFIHRMKLINGFMRENLKLQVFHLQ
ncbi:uncharacterized protein LOC142328761 isoform X2 [Lycorma delicatula]|uniref:uncharacterized protein LOC142328761 isoform X2 n=1 Tax=Lycorma delicatula TaxID=130591 RepID=UPI003F518F82